MSWCVSHWTVKSLSSLCAAVPLGIALILTAAEPAKAQFADAPSTSQPSETPQDQTSKLQADESAQALSKAESVVMIERDGAWAIAQFTPTPEPADSNNPLPTTAS